MNLARWILLTALLFGCSAHLERGTSPQASMPNTDPTQGYDTGSLATDTQSPTGAWPGAVRAHPGEAYTRVVDRRRVNTDRDITREIGEAILEDDALTSNRNVTITTHEGIVTIRGTVATERDRARVNAAAESVPGVVDIVNEVRVSNQGPR